MDIYFSFQAALFFSIAHIFIRRGLVESNAMTGSFISLSMTAAILWLMLPFFASLSALWTPVSLIFVAAGIFAPGNRPDRELHRHREDRRGAVSACRQFIADLCVDFRGDFPRRSLGAAEHRRNAAGDQRRDFAVDIEAGARPMA